MTDRPYLKKTGKLFMVIHPRFHEGFRFNNFQEAESLLKVFLQLEDEKMGFEMNYEEAPNFLREEVNVVVESEDDDGSKMNFRVVDGTSFWDQKDDFLELYPTNLSAKEIQSQLGLTANQYTKLVHECADEGLIVPRRKGSKPDRRLG